MFDPFSLALMGAGIGGLLDKKDPLRGALLGGAGGYFGPGLLGGASQAAAPVADAVITPVAEAGAMDAIGHFGAAEAAGKPIAMSEAQLMASGFNPANAAPEAGLIGGKFGMKDVKPYMDAAGSAAQVAGMFKRPEQAPIQHSPMMQPAGPNMGMNNLVASLNQRQQNSFQADTERRRRRYSLLGG